MLQRWVRECESLNRGMEHRIRFIIAAQLGGGGAAGVTGTIKTMKLLSAPEELDLVVDRRPREMCRT
jgi:hypothetical protein